MRRQTFDNQTSEVASGKCLEIDFINKYSVIEIFKLIPPNDLVRLFSEINL